MDENNNRFIDYQLFKKNSKKFKKIQKFDADEVPSLQPSIMTQEPSPIVSYEPYHTIQYHTTNNK